MERMKTALMQYQISHSSVIAFIQASLKNMEKVTNAVDPAKDSEIFAIEHKTGLSSPSVKEFELAPSLPVGFSSSGLNPAPSPT